MMVYMKVYVFFCLSLFIISAGNAGVVVNGTRFIYPAEQQSISIGVRNTEDAPFLVKSRVLTTGLQDADTFLITPPLFSLHSLEENKIRILYTGEALAKDRETLFYVVISAIPSGKAGANQIQVAIRSRFNLYYRPDGLPGKSDSAYEKIEVTRSDTKLLLRNPTPYYVTLLQFTIEGSLRPATMIAPFSVSTVASDCPPKAGCRIQWQTLNDEGALLVPVQKTIF